MERQTKYIIEEELARAIKKIIGKISDINFKGTYGLTDSELKLIHNYYDLIIDEDEDENEND